MKPVDEITYRIPTITEKWPIVIIGAGGIVEGAHLPAYRLAEFPIVGITDNEKDKASKLAGQFGIPNVYNSLQAITTQYGTDVIYDVAVPGNALLTVLNDLPDHSFVLMQKPMGENEQQAMAILQLCRQKKLKAAVNFQLRYAPYVMMAKEFISNNLLGEICDVEVYLNVYTPWHLWSFLYNAERVEILYHSIHYIDLVRHLLGQPDDIYAKTTRHPKMEQLQAVRSSIIMDYGDFIRANILTNHIHTFGQKNQDAYIKIEGTKGAIKIRLGLLMNYPYGIPDYFEYIITETGATDPQWHQLPVNGSWFPHAFIGSMAELMKARSGLIDAPDNSVEDCINTMKLVEAAYRFPARLKQSLP